jgi:hypothetical protein
MTASFLRYLDGIVNKAYDISGLVKRAAQVYPRQDNALILKAKYAAGQLKQLSGEVDGQVARLTELSQGTGTTINQNVLADIVTQLSTIVGI